MANPFQFESLPQAGDFCGREAESSKLTQLILDGKNVVLFGDRRYGKTSLIDHVFRQLPKDRLHAFSDLFDCTDGQDVAVHIYQAVYDALPFSLERKIKEMKGAFSRVHLGVELTHTGSTRVIPSLMTREFEMLMQDALEGAEHLCNKLNKTLVIALDEFQQVAEIKDKRVDALLRTYMQRMNRVSFIFSGSRKSILSNLFIDKSQPLYGMATSISIGGIETDTLKHYCEERLGQTFKPEAFEGLYRRVRGQTKLILQVCYWLYAEKSELTSEAVESVLDMVIQEKNEEFKLLFASYTGQQKKALKAIGRYDGKGLYQQDRLSQLGVNRQSLYQVLNRLVEVGDVVRIDDDRYAMADVHFHLWVMRAFG